MKIADEYSDEIIGKLLSNPAVENPATLPLNANSLQKNFNTQLELLFERDFADNEIFKKRLPIDECQTFSDAENELFIKIFGDCIGLFGCGLTGGNFKILNLSFIVPEKRRDLQTFNFVFAAFMKVFLPKVDTAEILSVLKENYFFTAGGLVFELIQTDKLNMLNVLAE